MYKIIAADYQAMEVRVFAHFSGDPTIQSVFPKGEDFYSRVGVDVFDRKDLSAHPNDLNFLKKVEPDLRDKSKIFSLSIPYGAEDFQVAAALGYMTPEGEVDTAKGKLVRDKYLNTYPNLKRYMIKQEILLKKQGYVTNLFGRVRRFDDAYMLHKRYGDQLLDAGWAKRNGLKDERKVLKTALNAAKNFPIQSTAASVVNRAMIELTEFFKVHKLDASVRLTVHDEVICIAHVDIVDLVSAKLEYYMCHNTFAKHLDVPLEAKAIVADNLGDAK